MRAEVIAVGTELLLGDIANTNAQEIGSMLADHGVDCLRHATVGDNEERIAAEISGALERADAVIVTGGLGPTQDDVTREAICRVTGDRLVRDPALEERLRAMFERMRRPMAEINLRQADRPSRAAPIEARIGTAPGIRVEHANGVIYAIPGPPVEMREMMRRAVVPDLVGRTGASASVVASRVLRVIGVAESALAEQLGPLWSSLDGRPVTMAFLASGGEIRVRLTAKAASREEAVAAISPVESAVREAAGAFLVGADDDTLESVVGDLLRARSWSVALAESLTGGLAGARLSRPAGSSEWFTGSLVTYATGAKTAVLGVTPADIERFGVVSEEVARAMAHGARRALATDVGLSFTGVAGPGAQDGVEQGTVCYAVDGPLGVAARTTRFPGERETVRALSAAAGLNLLRLYLLEALP